MHRLTTRQTPEMKRLKTISAWLLSGVAAILCPAQFRADHFGPLAMGLVPPAGRWRLRLHMEVFWK